MNIRIVFCISALILLIAMTAADWTLLKATYTPKAGSDREYGQGAVERNELAHREISLNVWLIRVPAGDTPEEWQRRLDAATGDHGTFRVIEASADERRRVESGEITLQK